MIRNAMVAAAALALASTTALAADLPSRKAPEAYASMAAPSWAGSYLGAAIGVQKARDEFADPVVPYGGKIKKDGVFGGLYGGHNWQYGALVFGVEADIEYGPLKDSSLDSTFTVRGHLKTDWQGSLRARVGYAVGSALLYVTGGTAFAHTKYGYEFPLPVGITDSFSRLRTGWTLGAGAEYAISNRWVARAEYRYSDFGLASGSIVYCCAAAPNHQRHEVTTHAVRLGLAYKFGGPEAVVAKY